MENIQLTPSSLAFLRELGKHNNRDWFNARKERFLEEQEQFIRFAEALLHEMNRHDRIETPSGKKSVLRIYRDTRFSKNKSPYHTRWALFFKRATKLRRGSYYLHLEPGNSFVEGGFWGPEAHDLKRLREEFSMDPAPLRKILKSKTFREMFGTLQGEQLKTAPKGFSTDDPAIDLIRYRQFLVVRKFSDKEVLAKNFLEKVNDTFRKMRPFLDYMSDVLTTDTNGISIVEEE